MQNADLITCVAIMFINKSISNHYMQSIVITPLTKLGMNILNRQLFRQHIMLKQQYQHDRDILLIIHLPANGY